VEIYTHCRDFYHATHCSQIIAGVCVGERVRARVRVCACVHAQVRVCVELLSVAADHRLIVRDCGSTMDFCRHDADLLTSDMTSPRCKKATQ
jgi:hypothetical protein